VVLRRSVCHPPTPGRDQQGGITQIQPLKPECRLRSPGPQPFSAGPASQPAALPAPADRPEGPGPALPPFCQGPGRLWCGAQNTSITTAAIGAGSSALGCPAASGPQRGTEFRAVEGEDLPTARPKGGARHSKAAPGSLPYDGGVAKERTRDLRGFPCLLEERGTMAADHAPVDPRSGARRRITPTRVAWPPPAGPGPAVWETVDRQSPMPVGVNLLGANRPPACLEHGDWNTPTSSKTLGRSGLPAASSSPPQGASRGAMRFRWRAPGECGQGPPRPRP